MPDFDKLQKLCQLVRYGILTSTTTAGSGHATSSLSAVELMTTLFFAGFLKYDLDHPENLANDSVIFSKGHASPLLYSLYHAAGVLTHDELLTLRNFDSSLEGHPTPRFKYVDVATGSLGQGLSIGLGMALGIKLKVGSWKLDEKNILNFKPLTSNFPRVFVLLGDSEMAEGQVWEAMEIASYYKLNNLIAVVDVNRLGQRGETMLGWDLGTYAKRAEAFGWEAIVVEDGHDLQKIYQAFMKVVPDRTSEVEEERSDGKTSEVNLGKPKMIFAKTIKGKGVSFLENKNGWHGKSIPKEQLQEVLKELGKVDLNARGTIVKPTQLEVRSSKLEVNLKTSNLQLPTSYQLGSFVATRQAYGDALIALGEIYPRIVVIDPEISNSTYAEMFREKFPNRFFEVFIAEQNAVSMAVGLEKMGFIPYLATFSAFFSRAFDQLRMAQYSLDTYHLDNDRGLDGSGPNLKLVGTHSGVFVGQDGPSQIGLEDLSLMRSLLNSTVLYPSDALSAFKLILEMNHTPGISYLRTTRNPTAIIYKPDDKFKIGGSKILCQSPNDKAVVFAAGITVHEALKAHEELKKENISICVVDLYSVKPLDKKNVREIAQRCKNVLVVEDHYPYGGLGEAVSQVLASNIQHPTSNFIHLSVNKLPRSGTPVELLHYEEIDAAAIINKVKSLILDKD